MTHCRKDLKCARKQKFIRTIPVLVEVERNINSVVEEKHKQIESKIKKVVNAMVELDQMKQELQTYESPLAEVRDSL